ncbi:lipopolysaccharide biosynthesis protein [Enterobacter ludwigii]
MRSEKTLRNVKVDLLITFSIVLLGFISRKVFIDYMGADFTGLMLLFVQLIGMINIAEMGVGTATASLLYKPLGDNDYSSIRKIVASAAKIYKYISLSVFVIGAITGVIVYQSVASVSEISGSQIFWLMYVINTAGSYLFAQYLILLTADQKYHSTRAIQGGVKIGCIITQLIVIYVSKNLYVYILCETIALLIQYLLFNYKIKKEYAYLFDAPILPIGEEFKKVKNKIKNVFFHKIGGVLVFNTDYIIISKFLTLSTVTLYSSYMMIFQALVMIVNILGNSVTASVGDFLTKKSIEDKKRLWNSIIILFFYIATCITLITIITIVDFVRLWIGGAYIVSDATLYFMAFNLFVLISRISLDILKNASGEFGDIYLPLIEGVINILISILLVNEIGFLGVVIGTTVSNVAIICLAKPMYLYRRVLHAKYQEFLKSMIIPTTLALTSVLIVISCKKTWGKPEDFIQWISHTFVATIFIVSTVTIVFLVSEDFRAVINKILITIRNKSRI